ncbi:MAG: hypothetical protein OEW23_08375 [Candidatus Aminicenantes bacterium]|nr:hypothetical protein [Candidatus Aminicenantes bacterium]
MRKTISLFLVFSISLLSGRMFAQERRGADIEIYKTKLKVEIKMEGTPWESTMPKGISPDFRGELIAVKKDSILLLDRYSGADVTIDFRDIGVIRIVKKSKVLRGAGLGLFIGAAGGALVGYAAGDSEIWISHESPTVLTADQKALISGILFGILGAVIGGAAGAGGGKDKIIIFEGKSDVQIQETLEKLRKKARVKNYQ